MATQNLNTYDRCRCIDYIGTPEALINAGLIQPDWVDGLEERHNRFIIGTGDRIEIVDRIGKGNFINHDLRAVGLIVLKKLRDGTLRAAKYRTALEERAIDEARTAQYVKMPRPRNKYGFAPKKHGQTKACPGGRRPFFGRPKKYSS